MEKDEPFALMTINFLESLGILRVVDETSRTFEKTGRKSIPDVAGCYVKREKQFLIANTIFHQVVQKKVEISGAGGWHPEKAKLDLLYQTFFKEKNRPK